jgi:hypothetical protein
LLSYWVSNLNTQNRQLTTLNSNLFP